MITAAGFVIAAAVAAVVRARTGKAANRSEGFAYGTLGVNLVGSFLLGSMHDVTGPTATVIAVGFLGTLTTFSGFARDTVALVELRRFVLGSTYLLLTIGGSVAAAGLGYYFARLIK